MVLESKWGWVRTTIEISLRDRGRTEGKGKGRYHVIDDPHRVRHGACLKACACVGADKLVDGDVAPGVVVKVETLDFLCVCWGGVGGAEDGRGCGRWSCVEGVAIGACSC